MGRGRQEGRPPGIRGLERGGLLVRPPERRPQPCASARPAREQAVRKERQQGKKKAASLAMSSERQGMHWQCLQTDGLDGGLQVKELSRHARGPHLRRQRPKESASDACTCSRAHPTRPLATK